VRADLVVELAVGIDLLDELLAVADLEPVQVLVLERAVESCGGGSSSTSE
jgi:hypothetical protein